jgi:hypothetical protein
MGKLNAHGGPMGLQELDDRGERLDLPILP